MCWWATALIEAAFVLAIATGCRSPYVSRDNAKLVGSWDVRDAQKSRPQPPPAAAEPTPALSSADSLSPAALARIDFGRYHALVIGNDKYRHLPKLRTARADAKAVASILRQQYGFDVDLLLDADRAGIIKALESYRRSLTSHDNLLIYYAGHGWLDKDADSGFWLPVDATRDSEVNWLSNATLTGALRAMQAKHVMVVADSCYSGKLVRGIHIVHKTPDYLERMATKKARVVLAAGGLEPVWDGGVDSRHSVFASAFLAALRENDGVMDGTTLFTRIRRPVMVNSDQTPEYADIRQAGHDGGDFLFVRK